MSACAAPALPTALPHANTPTACPREASSVHRRCATSHAYSPVATVAIAWSQRGWLLAIELLEMRKRFSYALPWHVPRQTELLIAAGKRLVRMHMLIRIPVRFHAFVSMYCCVMLGLPVLPGSLLPLAQPHPSTAPFDQPRGLLLSCTQATSPLLLQRHSFAEHAFARLAHMAASSACACLTCAIIGTILTLLLQ